MARPHPTLIDLATGRSMQPINDHRGLLRSASEHRMSGLVWSAVLAGDLELPKAEEQELARRQLLTRHHHNELWNALETLTERFADVGLGIATFKGVTAENRWYTRTGERPAADLDVLLSPAELDRADEAADLVQPNHRLHGRLREVMSSAGLQSIDLIGPGSVAIDFHFDALKLGIPIRQTESIWARSLPFRTPGGVQTRVLDAETSLILHVFHLLKDRFSRLGGLVDVVRIIEREEIDWEYVDRFLVAEGLEAPAYMGLGEVYDLLDLDPPAMPDVAGWRAVAWRRLWPERILLNGSEGREAHHRRQMMLPFLGRGRVAEAASSLAAIALPPRLMLDFYHPDTSGPYPWRLAVGRWRQARERRRRAESKS